MCGAEVAEPERRKPKCYVSGAENGDHRNGLNRGAGKQPARLQCSEF